MRLARGTPFALSRITPHCNFVSTPIMRPRTQPRKRRPERGYEACAHTCGHPGRPGIAPAKTIFAKEGSSCARHAKKMDIHPNCDAGCPAYHGRTDRHLTRPLTAEESRMVIIGRDAKAEEDDDDDNEQKESDGDNKGDEELNLRIPSRHQYAKPHPRSAGGSSRHDSFVSALPPFQSSVPFRGAPSRPSNYMQITEPPLAMGSSFRPSTVTYPSGVDSPIQSPRSPWGSINASRSASLASRSGSSALKQEWTSQVADLENPLRVLFVADPTRYSTLRDAKSWESNYWPRTFTPDFTTKDFQWLQAEFPQSIFKSGDTCYMHEFVSITVNFPIPVLIFDYIPS
jgi:hypothetical protein